MRRQILSLVLLVFLLEFCRTFRLRFNSGQGENDRKIPANRTVRRSAKSKTKTNTEKSSNKNPLNLINFEKVTTVNFDDLDEELFQVDESFLDLVGLANYNLEEIKFFDIFKDSFNKTYESVVDEKRAILNFLYVQRECDEHNNLFNSGKSSFLMALNPFSDLSVLEFNQKLNGFVRPVMAKSGQENENDFNMKKLPKTVNWVKKGYVNPVTSQGMCGSCWSFSAIGAVEGQIFKNTGRLIKFSEQNLIDCNVDGNFGCKGGDMIDAFNFLEVQNGVALASKYPYRGNDTFRCSYRPSQSGGRVKSYKTIEPGNEKLLQAMVAKYGPTSVAVDAALPSFHNYKSGIYYDPECSRNINHAMLLVGYGTEKTTKKDFWLVKNSYGENWGDKGYIKIARNADNHCGIAEFAAVPICY